jgi:nitrate reductase (cytochrome), electron transfer subunit
MRALVVFAAAMIVALAGVIAEAQVQAPFRPSATFTDTGHPPQIAPEITDDRRVRRNYPEQPPVIPHAIRDYEINLNSNRCLTCHSRAFNAEVGAPMISITHYVDRDGQVLASVAPRRFVCTTCHVPQTTAEPPVANRFVDVDTLLGERRQ